VGDENYVAPNSESGLVRILACINTLKSDET